MTENRHHRRRYFFSFVCINIDRPERVRGLDNLLRKEAPDVAFGCDLPAITAHVIFLARTAIYWRCNAQG